MRNVPVLLREKKRNRGYPFRCQAVFEDGRYKWNSANAPQRGSVFVFTSAKHVCVKDSLPRATFLCCFVERRRGWMCVCYDGARGKCGVAKAKNWCLWCRYWKKTEKKYILLVVLAVKAWKKAVQSCFMCVSHTCIVLRKFVYYTWRFKKVYKSIYIHIYYNKADILMCPFTNCPSVIVSLNRLPPELLPQVVELVLHFFLCLFAPMCFFRGLSMLFGVPI